MMKTANTLEYKVGINDIIASFVSLLEVEFLTNPSHVWHLCFHDIIMVAIIVMSSVLDDALFTS